MIVPKTDETMNNMTSKGKMCKMKIKEKVLKNIMSTNFSMTLYTSKTLN